MSQIITADQLVPVESQIPIGKCNSKADLNKLPCSPSCKILFVPPPEFLTIAKFLVKVSYEAPVTTATKFFIKHLTEPWKTLFKMFWAVVKNSHVDYPKLIWNSILYQVMQSSHKEVSYPRYTKLIINHVFVTHPTIPRRVDELYHNLKEDDPQTEAFKKYDDAFNGVEVPTMQPSLVVSTQGTNRTLRAPRSPKPKRTPMKRKEKMKPDLVARIPTTAKIEKEHMNKAEQVRFAITESAKEAEARENIKLVIEVVLDLEVDELIEGKEDEEGNLGFLVDLLVKPDTRLDPGSHKESPKEKDDDFDEDDNDDILIHKKWTGSLETKEQEKRVVSLVTKHRNNMIKTMKKNLFHQRDVQNLCIKIDEMLEKEVPPMVVKRTHQLVKANIRRMTHDITLQPPLSIPILALQEQLHKAMKERPQAQAADLDIQTLFCKCNHDNHYDDPPKGEKGTKKQKMSKESKFVNVTSSSKQNVKESQPTSSTQQQQHDYDGWSKSLGERRAPTTADIHRMKETLDDMMREWCKTTAEVNNEQGYGQDFLEEIVVKWTNVKAYIFSESNYNCVIWERVYDYQLGNENYQIKINLTAPTLTIPGIEKLVPYSILTDLFISIVYENNKNEKRVMDIKEFTKDKEVMEFFKEEIRERLKYRDQMKRITTVRRDYPCRDASLATTIEEGNIREIEWEPISGDTLKEQKIIINPEHPDQPITIGVNLSPQVLLNHEYAGRMSKWAIELSEYEITFRPRKLIKGKIMEDFFAEVGTLSTITTSKKSTMAGLVLRSPPGHDVTYAFKFEFDASNNESNYKALLAGLRIAKTMEVKGIQVFMDSLLVACSFSITQIPRGMNAHADALSKLSPLSFEHLGKDILVEVIKERSILQPLEAELANKEMVKGIKKRMDDVGIKRLLDDLRVTAAKSRRKHKKNIEAPHPSNSIADVPNEEHVPTHFNDPLLNGEDKMKLTELMDMCTKLSKRVLDLEHTKTAQAQEITNLKLRVNKLEKKAGFRTHNFKRLYKVGVTRRVESSYDESLGTQEDASKQGRSKIEAIDRDAEVTLVETLRRNDENDDNLMFDNGVFDGDEIVLETEEPVINAVTTTKSILVSTDEIDLAQEITLAQALAAMKSAKPKEKDVVQESSENVSTATTTIEAEEQAELERIQKERAAHEEASRTTIYEE
ncbi:putative ribonuclease H-like domain-containing protein [Tanacetum coccineum]|uniref:Ribonuclease H-like domain-containing protein n=1 Tax=Tanacetum coccineum TaxID=301880 RepID=A0ABQ4ZK30_9ASTR